ncbi:MAG: gliding motility-associated C-terminal domain-containing protein [Saprospiraceae bacterium]|nr:gliding motility-associated C-terminal domain-containing protein [Saprospiraceae bacterium]
MRKHLQLLCSLCFIFFGLQQGQAQCNEPESPGVGPNACAQAPIFCSEADLDGYCSSTYASGVGPCPPPFCGSCENYQFLGFIASSNVIQLEVTANNCTGTPNGSGVQAQIYDGCANPQAVSDCWSSGAQGTGVITATNLNIGQIYYLMVDGWAGDVCDYSIEVLQGVGDLPTPVIPGPISGPLQVCPGATLDYSVPLAVGATNYQWTITPAIGSVTNGQGTANMQVTWTSPGVTQLCVTPSNFCESGPPVCTTVIVTPIPPTFFNTSVCLGESVVCDGTTYYGPGAFSNTYDSWLGCDSVVTCIISLLPIVIDPPVTQAVCTGDCVMFDGSLVCETGAYSAVYDTWQGCDSTVTLILITVDAEAVIAPPPILGCGGGGTITLDGTGSTIAPTGGVGVISYLWTGPPGANISPNNQIMANVDMAGTYTLTVTQTYNGITCTDQATVVVTEDVAVPGVPGLNGPNVGCEGGMNTYTASPNGSGPPPTGYTWTVTGGTFVDNGNSIVVTWTNGTSGQVCVTADNDCGPSTPACITVTLGAGAALPNLMGPTEVCDGQVLTYDVNPADPTATYSWTVSGGASFTDNGSSINVDFDGASDGQVCVTATNSCGPSTEVCLSFMVLDVPIQPVIMGQTDLCLGQTETYSVMVDPNATSYIWTVMGGTFVDNGTSIDVTWTQTGGGEICVTAENVCGSSSEVCFQTTVNPAPSATISGSGAFCAGSGNMINLTIELTGTGPWVVTYQINGGSDTTIPISASPFTLQAGVAGTYTILSVTDQSSCPGIPNGSAIVTENPLPTATISGDESICAGSGDCGPLQIDFTGTGPWSITVALNGNPTAPINGIVSNPFIYDGCAEGDYTIVSVTDANACMNTGSGTGTITENTAPQAVGIMDACDITNTEFTITFEITGGDPATYTVNGSSAGISAGPPYIFTSAPMPTGNTYNFVVDDANSCDPEIVAGIVVCDCTTDVGTMGQTLITGCGDGDCVVAVYDNAGEVLDGDDVVEFVLHEGSGLSIVNEIARNSTPLFCFDANLGMTYGTTYYISAIVGNDLGGGTVDVSDPCLEVAQGTPVVFNEEPTATLAGNPVVCVGDVAIFSITFTGPGPYSITYEDPNGMPTSLSGISANPYSLQIAAPITGTYCLTGTANNNCPGVASGCGDVIVNTSPVVANVATACNTTVTAFTVTFEITSGDPGSYEVNPPGSGVITPGSPAIFTSNEIPAGNIYFFQVSDQNGCDTVVVTTAVPVDCDCVSSTGVMDVTPLDICGDGPAIAPYDPTGEVFDGDDLLQFVLHSGSGGTLGATIYAINSVPEFSFDPNIGMVYGVTYYISAIVGSDDGTGNVNYPADICLDVAPGTPVTFYEVPTGNLSGSNDICLGNAINVQVALTGDAPYTVIISDGVTLDTVTGINNTPYNYNVSPSVTTTYTLVEIFDENCPGTVGGTATVTVNEAPTAGAPTVTINPNNTGYSVCFDIMGGEPPYIITNGLDTLSIQMTTEFCSAEFPCGTGFYFEVDDANDCGPAIVEQAIVNCPCLTQVGTMDGTLIEICGNGPAVATYDPTIEVLDGNDVVNYILHNGNNVPISTAATPSFSFVAASMTYGVTYFISAQAGDNNGSGGVLLTDPCLSVAVGTPVIFNQIPTVVLSGGGSICAGDCSDLQFDVTGGEAPYTVVYETGAGVMDTFVSVSNSFSVQVCPVNSTAYNMVSLTDANCVGTVSGFATVNVNTPPSGFNVVSTIDPTNTFYTICFDIVGGDAATYTVDPPGTITGTTYCSGPLNCGDDYLFLLDDASGCGPDTIQGSVFCPCLSNSGTMTSGLLQFCEGATISVDPAVGEVLDGNDVQQYVLHTSAANILGTVLLINNVPSFDYDPAVLDCGITYYISSVVGDDDGTGIFDPTDFCLSVAFGQPVRWNCNPSAELIGGATLCEGDMTSIQFNLTGSGPFDVVLNNGVMDTTFTALTDGFIWDVMPTVTTTYTLISVTNTTTGCSDVATGSVTITVNNQVDAGSVADEVRLCADVSMLVNLADLLTGEDAGGAWSETSLVPSTGGAFNALSGTFNTVGQAPGVYTFRYFLDAGDPCPDDENTVMVTIDPVPVADAGADREITCDDTEWTLGGPATSLGTDLSYEWVELTTSSVVGASPELLVTDEGTYQLTVTNVISGCTSTDQVIVENSVAYPIPMVSVSDISCFGDDDGFFVIDNITGGVPPYLCSLNGGPFTQQKQFTNLSAGSYELVILDSKGCETSLILELTQPEELVVEIVTNIQGEDPIIELGDSVMISAVISIDSVDIIQWNPEGLVACDTCETTWAYPEIQTTFSVTVQEGECTDTDTYTIYVEKKRPVYIPNIFSPTSVDGNDIFFISAGPQVAQVRSFLVFDRWGETVFEYYNFLPNNPAYGWDGSHRGQALNPAVFSYFAEIEFIDGSVELFKGDVTLVR